MEPVGDKLQADPVRIEGAQKFPRLLKAFFPRQRTGQTQAVDLHAIALLRFAACAPFIIERNDPAFMPLPDALHRETPRVIAHPVATGFNTATNKSDAHGAEKLAAADKAPKHRGDL